MSFDNASAGAFEGGFTVVKKYQDEPLSECVRSAVDSYFNQLNGHAINDLYQMVLEEVERPLFESVMANTGGNQTKAAQLLGISRSTLRKKLAHYGVS